MTDIHTLAGAYALDAVTDLERAAFDRHVAQCPACAHEVAELRATAARLADITDHAPPPGLREGVLAQIHRTRQLGPSTRGSSGRPAPRWQRWAAAAVVAGVVAAGGGVAGYTLQDQRVRDAQRQAGQARAVEAVLTAPDTRVHTGTGAGGQVTVVTSDSLNEGVAIVNRLTAPGADHAYQLWLIRGEQATNAGVLAAGTAGEIQLFSGVRGAQAFGVTREPAGGSAAPTLPTLLTISLT
jgi:anti-sigma-K factor RskA